MKNVKDIERVVVLMLENRSFDHVLGSRALPPIADPSVDGVRHDRFNRSKDGTKHFVAPMPPARARVFRPDAPHHEAGVRTQMSRDTGEPMMGFVRAYEDANGSRKSAGDVMKYLGPADLPVTHFLADHFTICQRWFSPIPTQTIPNRLYSIAGHSAGLTDNPKRRDYVAGLELRTIFHQPEIAEDYRVYAGAMPLTMLVRDLRVPLVRQGKLKRMHRFFEDAENEALPDLCWLEPTYSWAEYMAVFGEPNDDHPPSDMFAGQRLLRDVYRALRETKAWPNTVLVITYDEHGGFYDHVVPPAITADEAVVADNQKVRGPRVPAIVVSPRAAAGAVIGDENAIYDHCSILKLICDWKGIEPLTPRVESARLSSLADLLLDEPRDSTPEMPQFPQLSSPAPRFAAPLQLLGTLGQAPDALTLAPGSQAEVLDDLRLQMEAEYPADFAELYPELVGLPPLRRAPTTDDREAPGRAPDPGGRRAIRLLGATAPDANDALRPPPTDAAAIRELQSEIEVLREDNRRLRELIALLPANAKRATSKPPKPATATKKTATKKTATKKTATKKTATKKTATKKTATKKTATKKTATKKTATKKTATKKTAKKR